MHGLAGGGSACSALTQDSSLDGWGLDLPRDWFADKFDRHFSNLASNHYPPLDDTAEGQLRDRPHTDHGAMTLLYRPSEPGGLEVHAQGHWWRVGFEPGSLVLNVGDILDRWATSPSRRHHSCSAKGGRDRVSLEATGPHISRKELGSATVEALLGRRETSCGGGVAGWLVCAVRTCVVGAGTGW